MNQHVGQEWNICFYSTDTHFAHSTERFSDSSFKGTVVGDNFYKQAVIEWRDNGASVSVATIQTDAVTGTGTVYCDLTGIRKEVVCRIFGGNSGLNRITSALYGFL